MKLKVLIILLFALSTAAWSQNKQSVLWEISGNGLKSPSYLLGTIHFLPGSILDSFPDLEKLIHASNVGMFEVWGQDSAVLDPELEKMAYPPLDSVFSKEEYEIVDSFFIKYGYGSIKEHNNDASLYSMFQLAIQLKEYNGEQRGFEAKIMQNMLQNNKSIFRLDNPDVVVGGLMNIWEPMQMAKDLAKYIKGPSIADDLNKIYDTQTYTSLLKADLHLRSSSPSGNKVFDLANRRNLLWLSRIESEIRSNKCFIVIGLGHLSYKQGLIYLLKKRGYKLKPLMVSSSTKLKL